MAQTGVQYPNKVDLVTRGDSCFHLVVVEEEELGHANALALQEKLNNYLDFALGGGLVKNFPEANGMSVSIRVDLYVQPEPVVLEFIGRYRAAIAQHGVGLELNVNGERIA